MSESGVTISFYRVRCDVDRFQYLLIEDRDWWCRFTFDGRPWESEWTQPPIYSLQPRLRDGVFWNFGLGAVGANLAVRSEALTPALNSFLNPAGELLPLTYEDRLFYVLNVTECIDALDRGEALYRESVQLDAHELASLDEETRTRLVTAAPSQVVAEPRFRLDRLGWPLFKVPETAITDLYYWERSADGPDEQFRRHCEREGLDGLLFDHMYTAESPW